MAAASMSSPVKPGHRGSTPGRKKYAPQDSRDVAACYVELTTDSKTGLTKVGVEDLSDKLEKAFNAITASHKRVGKNLIQHWGVINRDCRVFDAIYSALAKDATKFEPQLLAEANAEYTEKTSKVFKFEDAWRVLKEVDRIDKGDGSERIKRTPISKSAAGKRKRGGDASDDESDVILAGGSKRAAGFDGNIAVRALLMETKKQNTAILKMALFTAVMAELTECRQCVTMTIPSNLDVATKALLEKLKATAIINLPKLTDQAEARKEAAQSVLDSNGLGGIV
jgi:hypothetical protein